MPSKPLTTTLLISFIFILVFSIVLPLSLSAAEPTGLVTCGLMGAKTLCSICDLVILFQTLVNQAHKYFAFPLAALMLGYGGFLMVLSGFQGGNAGLYTKGKKVLTNSLIGIVIIFCSWLAIDTLLKTVGGYQHATSSNFGPWHEIECVSPAINLPTRIACDGDQCKELSGSAPAGCTLNSKKTNCGLGAEHLACKDGMCKWIPGEGKNECDGGNGDEGQDPKCNISSGLCTGVPCDDDKIDISKPAVSVSCPTGGSIWDKAIAEGIKKAGNIGGGIDTVAMVKAIISQESGGDIDPPKALDCGLMQVSVTKSNPSLYASACGVSPAHRANECSFYTNPANAVQSICIGTKILIAAATKCGGKTPRNIAAGYNGGWDACNPSLHCGSRAGVGECKISADQEGGTKKWECLWDDVAHTTCNATRSGNFSFTRKYVPKVWGCYNNFNTQVPQ